MRGRRSFLLGATGVSAIAASAATAAPKPERYEFSPFDVIPHRVWKSPGGERIISMMSMNDRLYVATETAIYEFPA